MTRIIPTFGLLFVITAIGCAGEQPDALLGTPSDGTGPMVVYEPLHMPEPEVPFPNNSATRIDPEARTGRRLNLATSRPLAVERNLRKQLNRLDGFSVFGPITVSFEAPLDLKTVTDESILLINVSTASEDFGHLMPLDLGRGAYPIQHRPRAIFPFEDGEDLPDLLFAEDNDVDGVRVSHWEVATNTLILRPLFPLNPHTDYAVVLTNELRGLDGESIRSPFVGAAHAAQVLTIRLAQNVLPGGLESIAFAWTFTTQSIADDLVAIRNGLDGKGPLGWLRDEYPGKFTMITDLGLDRDGDGTYEDQGVPADPSDHRYILEPGFLAVLLKPFGLVFGGLDQLSFENVDYAVFGRIESPDLRSPEDRAIWVNHSTGHVDHRPEDVPFVLTVPRTTAKYKPPFPVIMYSHGARTSRFELMLVSDHMARFGFAMMGIDAAGHGPFGGDLKAIIEREAGEYPEELIIGLAGLLGKDLIGPEYSTEGKDLAEVLDDLAAVGLWNEVFVAGRSEDRDGDGVLISGDGYFVPNPFEMNGNARQTLVDTMMAYRTLSRLSQDNVPAKALSDAKTADPMELMKYLLAGDFNADGILDIGGADNRYYAMGTSLGGIHTSMLMAVEPALQTGVPIVSGGGMTDIILRTSLSDAVDAIFSEVAGPAVVGCPVATLDDSFVASLSWNNWSLKCRNEISIAKAELQQIEVVPGGTVTLENPRLAEEGGENFIADAHHKSTVRENGGFSVTVAADKGDLLLLKAFDADGKQVGSTTELIAATSGLGRMRNSARFRRVIQIGQTGMDRGDPIAYARHLIRDPLGMLPRNILHLTDIGDRTVPFSTMVSWDRAVGLLGLNETKALEVTQAFIDHDALDGESPHWDIDDLLKTGDGIGPLPIIESSSGVSAVRYAATDDHEYIAISDPSLPIDWGIYSRFQAAWFFATDGQEIRDDLCLSDGSCDFLNEN
jgi:hypothetical protein